MSRKSGNRFCEKRTCSNKEVERNDDSKKSHPALGPLRLARGRGKRRWRQAIVRFPAILSVKADIPAATLRANSSKVPHSITSSARASTAAGNSNPIAFAVLRLTTSSYLVGACTGMSAGFSPLRMRST